mmetsp:Transcript_13096/g.24477  ORF Transcript_13096/g.24477 Transcript_13096/m.24477 type:complete len:86 (+) Transcript_13096:1615-1872(+)
MEGIKNFLRSGNPKSSVNLTCSAPAKDLVECVAETECFQSGRRLKDCTRNDADTARECRKEISEYYLCRRFSVDHSKHFVKDTYK